MAHTIYPWPTEFVTRMQGWLGDEAPAFFDALARRDVGLRLNSLRGPLEALRARTPWRTQPVPWCAEGLWLQEEASPGSHPYHAAGVYYVQDPSAMAAGMLLDPQPGEWVLDVAAAPGGKATHLAARMGGQGLLVANDVNKPRASALAANLERMGATNALVTNQSLDRLAACWDGLFDAVLVDAPCSGEGMFSRNSQAVLDWSVATVEGNARRQKAILAKTAPLVRPGGRLLYCTCTFAPEENEGVIAYFLAQHADFGLADLPDVPGLAPGHPEWIGGPADLQRTGRLWPHKGPGHGHFYALLRRRGEPPGDLPAQWSGTDVPEWALALYRQSLGEVLMQAPPEEGLILTESDDADADVADVPSAPSAYIRFYVTPMAPEMWADLRVVRPGWRVAALRHGTVVPDHALAMGLRPQEVRAALDLEAGDPCVAQYLQGGSWRDEGPPGLVLVTVDSFPLGWAKRGGGRLHSRYPVHLRQPVPRWGVASVRRRDR